VTIIAPAAIGVTRTNLLLASSGYIPKQRNSGAMTDG
jgi:hypothetical protein